MKIPDIFNDIRPFEPEELPAVYDRLLANQQFRAVLSFLYPDVPLEVIAQQMRACKTNLDFQLAFCYKFLKELLAKQSTGCDMDISEISNKECYTFMSNHRDIVLDSALLDMLLIEKKFSTTCEIAIGDNLLSIPWVLDIVRVNKSFIVKRGLLARERLAFSHTLSAYMHFAIKEKHENLWIAQREGRSKDSKDRTQRSILKMLILAGEGSALDRLKSLRISPLAISYEYDPCDYLKAAEYQARRDNINWEKGPMDDVISMRTGIMGYKGKIHLHAACCINDYLDSLKKVEMNNSELLDTVALHIDKEIYRNYKLFPNNYIALDLLNGSEDYKDYYTLEEERKFEQYLNNQLNKIEIPNRDEEFLTKRMLEMYANPAKNYLDSI